MHPFEKQTGCKVNVKVGNTSDEMVQLMKTGQYDGVSASGDATLRLIYGGDVAPVNTALVPNYATISDFLKNGNWNSVERPDVRHPARLGRQPADVEPGEGHHGARLVVRRVRRELAVQGQGHRLRLADLHRRRRAVPDGDPARRSASRTRTRSPRTSSTRPSPCSSSRRRNVGEYWSDYTKAVQAFESGTSVVGTTWQVIANLINADGKAKVETVLPKEGATGWSDTWMIASQGQAPELHVPVDELDHLARGERPGRRVVR